MWKSRGFGRFDKRQRLFYHPGYKFPRINRLQTAAHSPANCLSEPGVIKLDIINEVVGKTGITKTKAELAVETVFESMKKALSRGDRIELRGFGVFNVRPRKTGVGRNPRTGAEVSIPPGKAVRFKPGKELQSID
jgi:DNA-binding protein HU-beta